MAEEVKDSKAADLPPSRSGSICRRCKTTFDRSKPEGDACVFHKSFYVCRRHPNEPNASRNAPDWDGGGYYGDPSATGWPAKFWDCCGQEDPDAPGCKRGPHVSFDDPEG